jgi:pyruvate,orthophosphate dikinase
MAIISGFWIIQHPKNQTSLSLSSFPLTRRGSTRTRIQGISPNFQFDIRPSQPCQPLSRLYEIGAEGHLRDISTQLDEACQRKDRLIHFLRKQCHVESSSRIVDFIREVILFWKTGDKTPLESYLPPSIYDEIPVTGTFVDGPRIILNSSEFNEIIFPEDNLMHTEEAIHRMIDAVEGVSDLDRSRVKMIFGFYRLLNQKYRIDHLEIILSLINLPDAEGLALDRINHRTSAYMQNSKTLSFRSMTIYHKRHLLILHAAVTIIRMPGVDPGVVAVF